MATDFLLHGHEYMYDLDWLVKVVKRHSDELAQIDQKIADAIKIGLTDERIQSIVEDIISNASGMVNVKIPPAELTPATGDGSANDTAAIQGCIDYVHEKGYGVVFFPAGKYLVNDLTLYDDIGIVGMGRYTTTLTASGGSANHILGGAASHVSICQIGLNGNMSNQVDNIDGIRLTGDDFLFEGLLIEQCYEGINLTMQHGPVQATDILIDRMGLSGVTLIGGHDAVFKDLWINNISSTTGQHAIECQAYDSSFTNVHINSVIPVGFVCGADSCVFEGWITGVTTPYRITGKNNNIRILAVENHEVWNHEHTENVPNKTLTTTDLEINSERATIEGGVAAIQTTDFIENSVNPMTYRTPIKINRRFSYVPMKDSTDNYKVLVGGDLKEDFQNVKDYGAVGDGITNDWQSITNALAAANSNGTVFFPPGIYLVDKKIILGGNITVMGSGYKNTVIKMADGGNQSIIGTPLDEYKRYYTQIVNIGFDGNGDNQTQGSCIEMYNASEMKIIDVRCQYPKDHGIYIGGTESIIPYLESILIRGKNGVSKGHGVYLDYGASDVWLVDVDCGWFDSGYGFLLSGAEASSLVNCQAWQCMGGIELYGSDRCQLTNCLTDKTYGYGILLQESSALELTNCFIFDSNTSKLQFDGMYILGSTNRQATSIAATNITVYDTQYGTNAGIHVGQQTNNVSIYNAQVFGNLKTPFWVETPGTFIDQNSLYGQNTITNIDVTNADYNLNLLEVCNTIINVYGTPTSERTITMPEKYKEFIVRNSTRYQLNVKMGTGTFGVPSLKSVLMFWTGATLETFVIPDYEAKLFNLSNQANQLSIQLAALEERVARLESPT